MEVIKAIPFLLGGRCISANYIIETNLIFKWIGKIKLLDKHLNVKRESLHGEKWCPFLEWGKKIFGPSPEMPPSCGMSREAGAPWHWHFLWPLPKVLWPQGSLHHTTRAPAQMSFLRMFFFPDLPHNSLAPHHAFVFFIAFLFIRNYLIHLLFAHFFVRADTAVISASHICGVINCFIFSILPYM